MKDTAVIVVLLLLLASSHMLLSSRTIRARLVSRGSGKSGSMPRMRSSP